MHARLTDRATRELMSTPTGIERADLCREADGAVTNCRSEHSPENPNRAVERVRVSNVLEIISGNPDDHEVRTDQMESVSEDVKN